MKQNNEAWEKGREAYHQDPIEGIERNPFRAGTRKAEDFDAGFWNEATLSWRD